MHLDSLIYLAQCILKEHTCFNWPNAHTTCIYSPFDTFKSQRQNTSPNVVKFSTMNTEKGFSTYKNWKKVQENRRKLVKEYQSTYFKQGKILKKVR